MEGEQEREKILHTHKLYGYGFGIISGVYNYLLLFSILYFLFSVYFGLRSIFAVQTFIPEVSEPLTVPPELLFSYESFCLTLAMDVGTLKDNPEVLLESSFFPP